MQAALGSKVDWVWKEKDTQSVDLAARPTTRLPRLRIAYLIPHHNVTGGMKMIMRHIGLMKERGHWVQALFRGPPMSPVIPPWSRVRVDSEVLLTGSTPTLPSVAPDADVFLVGYFTQLPEFADALMAGRAPCPIVYWEQGHEHIFGDPTAPQQWECVFQWTMRLPIVLLSVSSVIRHILGSKFHRDAPVVPNAIDCSRFVPQKHPRHLDGAKSPRRVLLVGNPALPFKGFNVALQALNQVHSAVPTLEVTWICQVPQCDRGGAREGGTVTDFPPVCMFVFAWLLLLGSQQVQPTCTRISFPIHFVVNPTQVELPVLYRAGYDCFLFTSKYEAWGMPVLEVR